MNYGNATQLSLLAFQDQVDALEEQVIQLFGRESKHHGVVKDLHKMIDMAGTPWQKGHYGKLIRNLKRWGARKEWLASEIKRKTQAES